VTTTPADVASALSLGVSAISLIAFALAFADADASYFDPRPLLLAVWDRLLVELVRARHTVRDVALTAAALLLILTAPSEASRA
jgi:hypothetical protein